MTWANIFPDFLEKIEFLKNKIFSIFWKKISFIFVPSENDQLELNYEEDNGYKFTFKKGKWVFEEWYGEHPIFEHKNTKEGLIDSLPSKLKEVYKRYLNIIEEEEMDIVQCGWSNYRMSEKSLIDYVERRIRGEKMKSPDDYFPFWSWFLISDRILLSLSTRRLWISDFTWLSVSITTFFFDFIGLVYI
jgi:hypothetical protein